jgi:hypothetical protein
LPFWLRRHESLGAFFDAAQHLPFHDE